MIRILDSQSAVWEASRDALDFTHRELTGEPFPESVSDAAARTRLVMMILKARDYVEPGTVDVLSAVVRKGIKMENKYKEGTLAAELSAQIAAKPEAKARESIEPPKRRKLARIQAVTEGERMQKGSQRFAVFTQIKNAGAAGVTIEELDAAQGFKTSGHVQKLLASGHVISMEDEAEQPSEQPAGEE